MNANLKAGRGCVSMFAALVLLAGGLIAFNAVAEERLATLQVGSDTFTNVTVTTVTATDIYFTHSRGLGNAKLKNLTPELQKHFHFDGSKAAVVEKNQSEANARYRTAVAAQKSVAAAKPRGSGQTEAPGVDEPEIRVGKLYAKSIRGERAPELVVQQWLTKQPETRGKFVLVEFWATWCPSCRASIPLLNAIHKKYEDKMVVIGVSDESAAEVRALASQHIDYYEAVDPQRRMYRQLGVTAIPHSILIDPNGIVRFEGMPTYLSDQTALERLLAKYAD